MDYKSAFFKSLGILVILTIFYFNFKQYCYALDSWFFYFLNNNLLSHKPAQYLFGWLSHKNESWLNVVVMISIHILAIIWVNKVSTENMAKMRIKKYRPIALSCYCWLSFQIILLINHFIFNKWLQINRSSPSAIYPAIKLSVLLNNYNIKDVSNNSFPAGHALVVVYWWLFLRKYANTWMQVIAIIIGILFIIPRIVTGAHWMSDVIFSLILGWVYFNLAIWLVTCYEKTRKFIC